MQSEPTWNGCRGGMLAAKFSSPAARLAAARQRCGTALRARFSRLGHGLWEKRAPHSSQRAMPWELMRVLGMAAQGCVFAEVREQGSALRIPVTTWGRGTRRGCRVQRGREGVGGLGRQGEGREGGWRDGEGRRDPRWMRPRGGEEGGGGRGGRCGRSPRWHANRTALETRDAHAAFFRRFAVAALRTLAVVAWSGRADPRALIPRVAGSAQSLGPLSSAVGSWF